VSTLATMRSFLGDPAPTSVERVRSLDARGLSSRLTTLALDDAVRDELLAHWDETRASPRWASLLASLVECVERDRGNIDAPIPIWPDLNDDGPSGRLLYYYLFALQVEELAAYHDSLGLPEDVHRDTLGALARHGETHRRQHASVGVDAGWWMLPILRGELMQVRSLKFHRVHLERGTLAPRPWLDEASARSRGAGFLPGDESLGVHIPARIDLSPAALDATWERAREVLGRVWPHPSRRLATCQSWMMDERLVAALGPTSNIVRFQQRFELIDPYEDDVTTVAYFVFGAAAAAAGLAHVTPTSRVQRVVLETLRDGGTWHNRTGWLDFD